MPYENLARGQQTGIHVFVDLDDTICDFTAAYEIARGRWPDNPWPQSRPGFFLDLLPLPGAIETLQWLESCPQAILHILSAPSCRNPLSYMEKRIWVEQHLGYEVVHRFHLSPDKGLFKGELLIDDNPNGKGQERFQGRLLHFGSSEFPDWRAVREELERMLEPHP